MISSDAVLKLVNSFSPEGDDLALKSQELTIGLLSHTQEPFSRRQFTPGHITCTAAVLSPDLRKCLLMFHHRHCRWLLPGGHVEREDRTLATTARREAYEETGVITDPSTTAVLVGMDVHGIPAKKREPFHLHHDLIFALAAESEHFHTTDEAPRVAWCRPTEFAAYGVVPSITRSVLRAQDALERLRQRELGLYSR